jgi:hypothetical protein
MATPPEQRPEQHFTEKSFSVNPLQKALDYGLSFFSILIYFAEL